ncbi:putative endonuclease [Alphaproteobacteria bacterium]
MFAKKLDCYNYGLEAEEIALNYLLHYGYTIIAKRFKTPYGEIDLIAGKEREVIFVEVKARRALNSQILLEIVTAKQQSRCVEAAECFLASNTNYNDFPCRFDLIIVKDNQVQHHIEDAW